MLHKSLARKILVFKFKVQRCRDSEDGLGLVGAGVLLCNAMLLAVKSQSEHSQSEQSQSAKVAKRKV